MVKKSHLVFILGVLTLCTQVADAQLIRAKTTMKIACIGNSITAGVGVEDGKTYSYPAQLQRMLGKGWEVRNFGVSGTALIKKGDYPYWVEKEFSDALSFAPDIVIIKLGTNDSKPWNWKYSDEFSADYTDLLRVFQELPSHPRVYFCTPVPAFPGDWGINDSVINDGVIPIIKKIAREHSVPFIDLYSSLSSKPEFFPDKVHPNENGAAAMAWEVYGMICKDYGITKAPKPLLPIPSMRQLVRQEMEYYGFFHFTMNTFTDKEWGYGDESPTLFNPTDFNADEIVRTAKESGMKGFVLTCKHHDGFSLWQSMYTDHSVKFSPWRNGNGDVVKEFSDACRRYGLKFGIYLSPWDRNHKDYGKPEYIAYYRNQLKELLTNYGEISEVWFDGANGGDGYYGGAREKRMIDRTTYYGWEETWNIVRELQPHAVIFSDVGPDIRWVGNENGYAGETCWSMYSPVGEQGGKPAPGDTRYQEGIEGHRDGARWIPAECDVSIRPGWFYHAHEDSLVKSPEQLFDLYCKSVGRNSALLLNVPPDRRGRLHDNDVKALMGFKKMLDDTFRRNLGEQGTVTASAVRGHDARFTPRNVIDKLSDTYWTTDDSITQASLTIQLKKPTAWNVMMLQEYIPLGQRVEAFSVEVWNGKQWKKVAEGTTIGYKRLLRIPTLNASKVRLNILKSKACPIISSIGLYNNPSRSLR